MSSIKKIIRYSFSLFFSQGVLLLFTPLLVYMYGLSNYGIYGIYISVFSFCSGFATMRVELLFATEKSDKYFIVKFLLITCVCILCSVIVFFIYGYIMAISVLIALLSAAGITLTTYRENLLYERLRPTYMTNMVQPLLIITNQVAFYFCFSGSLGLLIGDALSRLLVMCLLFSTAKIKVDFKDCLKNCHEFVKKYRGCMLVNLGISIISYAKSTLLIPVCSYAMFDTKFIGILTLFSRYALIPSALIGQGLALVFVARITNENNIGTKLFICRRLNFALYLISLLLVVIYACTMLAYRYFDLTEPKGSVYLLSAYLLFTVTVFSSGPIRTIYLTSLKQKPLFLYDFLAIFGCVLIFFLFGVTYMSVTICLLNMAIFTILINIRLESDVLSTWQK